MDESLEGIIRQAVAIWIVADLDLIPCPVTNISGGDAILFIATMPASTSLGRL